MKQKNRKLPYMWILLCVFLLVGCGMYRPEAVSDETVEETVDEVTKETTEEVTGEIVNQEPAEDVKPKRLMESNVYVDFVPAETLYYHSQLSEQEKRIYDQVYQALTQRTEETVDTLSVDVLDKIFICVLNDHPEIFYVSGYVYTSHSRGDETVSLTIKGNYEYDEAECEKRIAAIEKEAKNILTGIPADATDYDKIKHVFDKLVTQTEYVSGSADNQNICSVFMGKQSTCQGYAKATQYLLNQVGVEATFVSGSVEDGSHAWNLVKADGDWYYLDTTWGDVDYQTIIDDQAVDESVMAINYDYFLISSDKLYKTHEPNRPVPLPDCIATSNNYYVHEGRYLTGVDAEVFHEIFDEAYANGETTVQIQCANDEVFEQVSKYLLEEQHIFDYVKAGNSVAYTDNPETDTFCFWL